MDFKYTHSLLHKLDHHKDFIDVGKAENIFLDIRYASENNFMKKNVYQDFNRAYLHKIAAEKLDKANSMLLKKNKNRRIVLFDCLRPRSAQRILWKFVENTPMEIYVANPDRGSVHNFGMAIDLTLADSNGNHLDMGTEFDSFTDLAQPVQEEFMLKNNLLTQEQYENRLLLRSVMEEAGFYSIKHEWWHFDAEAPAIVRSNFEIIE